MERYQQLFSQLQARQEAAFVPFVTIGDPTPELSLAIIQCLIEAGADALELGIPFSDPLADGPTIQAANLRALTAGTTPATCFGILTKLRQQYPQIPIGLLVYANIVYRHGVDTFYQHCANAGVDSVLIADVPVQESAEFRQAAQRHAIASVFICPPNADQQLINQIAQHGQGYTYLLSRAGVTGSENSNFMPLEHLIQSLTAAKAPPIIQGFGISTPDQVQTAVAAGAQGAISGSAIVKLIEQHAAQPEVLLEKLRAFVSSMKAATKPEAN